MWMIPLTEQVRAHRHGRTVVLHGAPDGRHCPGAAGHHAIVPPFTTVTINSVTLTDVKDSPVGVNVGVDGTYWIRTISSVGIGVGGFVRYAGASLDLEVPPGVTRDTELKAGGPQGGTRFAPSVLMN